MNGEGIIICKNTPFNRGVFNFLGYYGQGNINASYIKKDPNQINYVYTNNILDNIRLIKSFKDDSEKKTLEMLITSSGRYFFEIIKDYGDYLKGEIYGDLDYQSNIMPNYYRAVVDSNRIIEFIQRKNDYMIVLKTFGELKPRDIIYEINKCSGKVTPRFVIEDSTIIKDGQSEVCFSGEDLLQNLQLSSYIFPSNNFYYVDNNYIFTTRKDLSYLYRKIIEHNHEGLTAKDCFKILLKKILPWK